MFWQPLWGVCSWTWKPALPLVNVMEHLLEKSPLKFLRTTGTVVSTTGPPQRGVLPAQHHKMHHNRILVSEASSGINDLPQIADVEGGGAVQPGPPGPVAGEPHQPGVQFQTRRLEATVGRRHHLEGRARDLSHGRVSGGVRRTQTLHIQETWVTTHQRRPYNRNQDRQ